MRVLFAGGGTLGSVSPLIAIYHAMQKLGGPVTALWVGSRAGPERAVVQGLGLPFQPIISGKLRRYWDWRTLLAPLAVLLGLVQSWLVLRRFRPHVVVSAGSFVAVPVALAAWLRRVPIVAHQLDARPTLTNRLIAPLARAITVSFASTAEHFLRRKTTLTGNPVRGTLTIPDPSSARAFFQFDSGVPVVLVIGGGTGAAALNRLVWESLPQLLACAQVLHLTGRGKMQPVAEHPRYRAYEFLDAELAAAFGAADLVVSRGGGGTLSELAVLGKPAIVVPIPGSYQEANAIEFAKRNAAVVLPQAGLSPAEFARRVCEMLRDPPLLTNLSRNIAAMMPANAAQTVAQIVRRIGEEAA